MFRVSHNVPYDPELGDRPDQSDVLDTREEADAWIASIRQHGGIVTEDYEMDETECYHHNVAAHCPDGY